MKHKSLRDNLKPDYFVNTIYDIDKDWLAAKHIEALIIDVDNTIIGRFEHQPDRKLRCWIKNWHDSEIKLIAVSNNWTERVKKISEELGVPLLAPAAKPLKMAFKKAVRLLAIDPGRAAIIGDQLFTDVLGGNRAGVQTVLVAPVTCRDPIHTKILRIIERTLLVRLCRRVLVDGRWKEL